MQLVDSDSRTNPRIVLVLAAFPKTSETFIVHKVCGLIQRGLDIVVVCDSSETKEWERFPQLEKLPDLNKRIAKNWPTQPRWLVPFLCLSALTGSLIKNFQGSIAYLLNGFRRWGLSALKFFYIDAAIIAAKPDIVHFEFGALAVHRMHLKDLLGCKVLVSFRGYDLNFSGLDQPGYYDQVWDKADGVHCLGEDLWVRAQRRGCPANKFHKLIPPAVDAITFSPVRDLSRNVKKNERSVLRILSVGRLEWKKGYEFALSAIRLLRDQGIFLEYKIIGSGTYLEALAFSRHQLVLDDCVQFLGAMSQQEIRQQMNQANIFLHAAVSEGFCNAVLEAQAMELPIVCTDADGLSENVKDGVTGFVVSRRDPRALAEKIHTLAQAPALRNQMGKAGRQRVIERFSLETQLKAFADFFFNVQHLKSCEENSDQL